MDGTNSEKPMPQTRSIQRVVMGELSGLASSEDEARRVGDLYPKRRASLSWRTIDGETLILNREEGRLHQLNSTASFIWDCCDGNSNVAEITERLVGVYDVDARTAHKDVEEVLLSLRNSKLLE